MTNDEAATILASLPTEAEQFEFVRVTARAGFIAALSLPAIRAWVDTHGAFIVTKLPPPLPAPDKEPYTVSQWAAYLAAHKDDPETPA